MAPYPCNRNSRPLLFALNGSKVELSSVDPSITLLAFLRSNTRFKGAKLGCGEGGCGACLVILSKYDTKLRKVEHFSMNSCLTLLCSIDGCSITTIEGLGGSQKGFHPVQERIAAFHGSQCGFCTPGMCIAMYACVRNASDSASNDAASLQYTIPNLSVQDAQQAVVGNICRCTGYRPILDACSSFASNVDVEDLGINTFWACKKDADMHLLLPYAKDREPEFPAFLIKELDLRETLYKPDNEKENGVIPELSVRHLDGPGEEKVWVEVLTLESAFRTLQAFKKEDKVKLVVGNTSSGYYKDERPKVFIDINRIPELLILEKTVNGLEVGSAITIAKLINALEHCPQSNLVSQGLVSHLKKVANPHVRNRASVGGNLIMAQQFVFGSDLVPLFLSIDVTLKLVALNGQVCVVSMEEFLQKCPLPYGTLLLSICIPLWDESTLTDETDGKECNGRFVNNGKEINIMSRRHMFKSYRAAPRALGNALAHINAAFLAEVQVSKCGDSKAYEILDVKLAFGAFGQSQAIRVKNVECFLIGKTLSPTNLLEATHMLKTDLSASLKHTTKHSYKLSVAVGFFFDFFGSFLPKQCSMLPAMTVLNGTDMVDCLNKNLENGVCNSTKGLSSNHLGDWWPLTGKQTVPSAEHDNVVGKPLQKFEAKIQAAGEAVYVDDIPSPDQCLFAAFVLSDKAKAAIKSVDPQLALASPGVFAYISAKDIPEGGMNIGAQAFGSPENLFATGLVEFVGHPIGLVVADSPQHAKDGATKVSVEYDIESSGAPILSIEEAVEKKSFFPVAPILEKVTVGDIVSAFCEAHEKILNAEVRTGSQYYFYMETQTALALPDEDGCIVVYSSTQMPDILQKQISLCLGIPHHNVRVITRRVGGGFGGKAFRSFPIALACAVAANKLRRPVRIYLDRRTDMLLSGGRHPMKTIYSVGFTSSGQITGLEAKIFIDAGWSEDMSTLLPLLVAGGLKKYNWGSMNVEFKVCKTNLASKSAMRAPGHLQGSFIADSVLEHVASVLGLDVHMIITRNMHTLDSIKVFHPDSGNLGGPEGYTLPQMWSTMVDRTAPRMRDICMFNSSNALVKRGLSMIPVIYDVQQMPKPARVSIFSDGSVVVEVGGIEIGQGLWTKVRQTTMWALSPLWPMDHAGLLEQLLKVRVVQSDTVSLPHGGITGGSTTSEGSCEAVREASEILVKRLMPLKIQKEQESSQAVSWQELIALAQSSQIDLSAQAHWFPDESSSRYLNYGVAATEVEINALTGEVGILRTDLMYDCGKSLNPAVDIGQIEGSFVQGIGFFTMEDVELDSNGSLISDGTWNYKPPTLDNVPRQFFVEIINGAAHEKYILSSKASGEPPLLLAGSVHSAIRHAIEATHEHFQKAVGELDRPVEHKGRYFRLDTPATMEKVKHLCGLDIVEKLLEHRANTK